MARFKLFFFIIGLGGYAFSGWASSPHRFGIGWKEASEYRGANCFYQYTWGAISTTHILDWIRYLPPQPRSAEKGIEALALSTGGELNYLWVRRKLHCIQVPLYIRTKLLNCICFYTGANIISYLNSENQDQPRFSIHWFFRPALTVEVAGVTLQLGAPCINPISTPVTTPIGPLAAAEFYVSINLLFDFSRFIES